MEQKFLCKNNMKHVISLHPDGYIYFKKDGDFLLEDAKTLLDQLISLCKQQRESGKSVKIFGELIANGGFDPKARNLFVDNINRIDFDRIAAYSDNLIIKNLVNFFLLVAGDKILKDKREVKFFNSKQNALEWLKNTK